MNFLVLLFDFRTSAHPGQQVDQYGARQNNAPQLNVPHVSSFATVFHQSLLCFELGVTEPEPRCQQLTFQNDVLLERTDVF